MNHIMILFCILVNIFCSYTTAWTGRVDSVTYYVNTDGSITLRCQIYFSGKASKIDHSWIFHGKNLTKNTDILVRNPSRYNVRYQSNGHNGVYTLTISSPVHTDEGKYWCRIDYRWDGNTYFAPRHVDVTINSYLPPLNYPLCSIKPFQILSNGNPAEFKCEVGATTAQITLNLTLQTNDGFITHLSNTNVSSSLNVTRTVTLEDNNSMFICEMTSETFPTAYRTCSAGPLIIHGSTTIPPEKLTTDTSKAPQSLITTNLLTWKSQPGTSNTKLTTLLVGCVLGALIVTLLIIIGVLCRGQTPRNTLPTVDSTITAYQTDSESEPNALLNQTGDLYTGTRTLPNSADHQNIHIYEHTIKKDSMVTSSYQGSLSPTVDYTTTPYQVDYEPEPNAVLDQNDDSHTETMTIPNPEYQNMHMYEHTIEMHSMAPSPNQVLPTLSNSTFYKHTISTRL